MMFHMLFRSFLQRELRKRDPLLFNSLHLKAAEWFAEQDDVDSAFYHYVCAGAPEQASDVVERMLPAYYSQGKVETLLAWHTALNQEGIPNPSLVYHAALIHSERLEHTAALTALDQAEKMCVERDDAAQLVEIRLQRARVHLVQGHYLAAIAQAEPLLNTVTDNDKLHSRSLRVVGFAYFRLGKTDLALRYLEEAVPLSRAYGDKLALSNLLQDLQVVYLRMGRFDDAAACLQEVVAIRRMLGGSSFLAYALNDLGYHYHQHGDYGQALAALQEGFSVIAATQNRRIESYLLWSMGDLQRDLGSFHEAWQLYSRALEFTANQEPSLRCNLLISASILRRWQHNYDEAVSLAEEAHTLAQAHSLSLEERIAAACYWVACGYQGDIDTALIQLLELSDAFKMQSAVTEAAFTLALYAQIALIHHDKDGAAAQLLAASQLLKQGGSMQPLLAEIIHSGELDKLVLAKANKFPAIMSRLSLLRNSQFGKPVVIDLQEKIGSDVVYSLRVYSLGREKIERDGVPVLPSDWQAAAARELFFMLLRGPQSREAISLEFWPDSSPAQVRSNFHTTLYRVRLALGENVIVYHNDLYSINPEIDLWYDVHEFQGLVQRAQSLSVRDARTEDLYRRAVDLYQGDFLSTLDQAWIVYAREELNESYLEALNGLGRCAQARRDFRQALRLYKQVLKLDPFREDVHRSIMSCFAEQGERQKVYAHFKYMQTLFQEELALEPTRETQIYAKTLLS
jgi:DNA-binding SARP family transcriptional activator/Flp pilus assembly protein TadD